MFEGFQFSTFKMFAWVHVHNRKLFTTRLRQSDAVLHCYQNVVVCVILYY